MQMTVQKTSIDVLEQYFEHNFSVSNRVVTEEMVQAQDRIDAQHKRQSIHTEQVTSNRVRRLITQLKLNASPAQDGITAEHLIYTMDSHIIDHLSYMLTLCIQFGVVPDNFGRGVLITLPKKAGCDTTQAKNWRPITVSSTFSKLLEVYVLKECSSHEFSDFQFVFVKGRETEMALDAVSHCTLFEKAHSVLPMHCWFVMHKWYSRTVETYAKRIAPL